MGKVVAFLKTKKGRNQEKRPMEKSTKQGGKLESWKQAAKKKKRRREEGTHKKKTTKKMATPKRRKRET